MILELLLGSWAINSICKDIDNCIEAYENEQDELYEEIDNLHSEISQIKNSKM